MFSTESVPSSFYHNNDMLLHKYGKKNLYPNSNFLRNNFIAGSGQGGGLVHKIFLCPHSLLCQFI